MVISAVKVGRRCAKIKYDSLKPYIAITDKTRKKMMETNF
jgi:hypothetical protein